MAETGLGMYRENLSVFISITAKREFSYRPSKTQGRIAMDGNSAVCGTDAA